MSSSCECANEERRGEPELAEQIVAYLAERPQAMDTLEGIARWWLLRQQVRVIVERVEGALEALTAEGVLELVQVGPDRHYRLRRQDSASLSLKV